MILIIRFGFSGRTTEIEARPVDGSRFRVARRDGRPVWLLWSPF